MICLEKFINNELNKYGLTFNDFLREVDDTQDKPKIFHDHRNEILQCRNIKKLRILLEKYYFSEVNPYRWIMKLFSFSKRFNEPKFYNIEDKDTFWYNLSSKWRYLISMKLKENPSIIIKPYCSKEENKMNYNYFDGVKKGDRVWGFGIGWTVVTDIIDVNDEFKNIKLLVVSTDTGVLYFDFNGFECDKEGNRKNNFQSLFWDEVKFKIPKSCKIKLKENKFLICLNDNYVDDDKEFINARVGDYTNENGLFRNDKETAKQALNQIKKFTKLLALRDQECPNSRGYKIVYNKEDKIFKQFYTISKNLFEDKFFVKWCCEPEDVDVLAVPFRTEEDAQKICDFLNSGMFSLEEEE